MLKLIGIAVILACAGGIIGVIITLITGLVFNQYHFSLPINFFEYHYINQVYVVISLVVIIPLVGLIMLVSRLVFNTGKYNSTIGYTLLMIWICAFVMLIYHGSRVATEFNESASFTQTINIKPVAKQTYYLRLNDVMFLTKEDSARLDIENRFKNMTLTDDPDEDNREPRSLDIDIVKAEVSHPVLIENFTSRGRDYDHALINARNTRYIFLQQDSILKFDRIVRRNQHDLWHNERVKLTLQIPLNATIFIDDRINNYINNSINIYECNIAQNHGKEASSMAFIMTDNGLECKTDSIMDNIQHKKDSVATLSPISKQ
ncbi:hypothetical protein HH214_12175 [Mucilaginibacter robiniae]|uniref:Uncharacterized protein n=1 Tax=Mucilaginibacter robiniae TaxID=2728022 RepID=A0A7L5E0M9_9SPHI|nr:hypothetical protein [Mucilaginibacter robiniae]QJD96581.1 hypothetical protein HH214_12175 [Mucilaginibacter robiniae]